MLTFFPDLLLPFQEPIHIVKQLRDDELRTRIYLRLQVFDLLCFIDFGFGVAIGIS